MDFYHSWLYVHVLNTTPFIWTIVVGVFAFNILGPVLVWFVMNSKAIPFLSRLGDGKGSKKANENH